MGNWCDSCGGVAGRKGLILLRHVATLDGKGGRFPIVYDISTSDYAATFPKAPDAPVMQMLSDMDIGFHAPTVHTVHGTLDGVIAVMQPISRGDAENWPELSVAPTATDEEKSLLGIK